MLTVGFARRLATYKRLNLLLQDVERAMRVVGGDRPIQVLLAGKAHPRDDAGKSLVQGLFSMKHAAGSPAASPTWTTTTCAWPHTSSAAATCGSTSRARRWRPPARPGMKNVMNGGLQLSVLDGWWAEGYDGGNGWALSGDVDHDHGAQDARHAHELFRLLEEEVAPEYYKTSADGIPRDWVARIRRSLRTLGPEFGAGRMLEDYERKVYT